MSRTFGARAVVAAARGLRQVPAPQLALRALLLLTGAAALMIAPGGRLVPPGLVALVAAPALFGGVVNPDGQGPAVVAGAAAAAWTIRYGVSSPPFDATLAVAGALVLHHSTAALCAAMPATSRVEPGVVLRWAGQVGTVLAVAGGVAAAARLVGRSSASVPLELAGIAAVVLAVAVPVLLFRRD
jgi:hypothetical protein